MTLDGGTSMPFDRFCDMLANNHDTNNPSLRRRGERPGGDGARSRSVRSRGRSALR